MVYKAKWIDKLGEDSRVTVGSVSSFSWPTRVVWLREVREALPQISLSSTLRLVRVIYVLEPRM